MNRKIKKLQLATLEASAASIEGAQELLRLSDEVTNAYLEHKLVELARRQYELAKQLNDFSETLESAIKTEPVRNHYPSFWPIFICIVAALLLAKLSI